MLVKPTETCLVAHERSHNLRAMAKPKLHRWRISRIRGTPAEFIGYVEAENEEQAIKQFEMREDMLTVECLSHFVPISPFRQERRSWQIGQRRF